MPEAKMGEVTETYEEALEAGFWGQKVDPRPNEDYTVSGSIARAKETAPPPA